MSDVDDVEGMGPWPGEDSGDDVIVVKREDGRAVMMTRSMMRLIGEAAALRDELLDESYAIHQANLRLDQLVPAARAAGMSWNAIASCLGMTATGVRKRWQAACD